MNYNHNTDVNLVFFFKVLQVEMVFQQGKESKKFYKKLKS